MTVRSNGFLPENAPDPRMAQAEKVRLMPVPVMGFVEQPALEDVHMESTMISGTPEISQIEVGISYTLWRKPDDRSDPANLAELDASIRRSLDGPFPAPRPAWLIERVERMKYPMLCDAVKTTWHRDPSEFSAVPRLLLEHTNNVLVNRFRDELGLGDIGVDRFAPRLTDRAVNPAATVTVDGVERQAYEIDSDPFVYAIGAQVGSGSFLTAVVPRDDLEYVQIAFARRPTPCILATST